MCSFQYEDNPLFSFKSDQSNRDGPRLFVTPPTLLIQLSKLIKHYYGFWEDSVTVCPEKGFKLSKDSSCFSFFNPQRRARRGGTEFPSRNGVFLPAAKDLSPLDRMPLIRALPSRYPLIPRLGLSAEIVVDFL